MGKIIIITFAFMAFAFYEMSGGDQFVSVAQEKRAALEIEAEKTRVAQADAKAERDAELALTAIAAAPKPQVPTTQVILASAVAQPQSDADEVQAAVLAALDADKAEALTQEIQTETADLTDPVAEPVAETRALDVREVTAARVNMRNGPGQSFDVMAKLTAGEQVEILQDPGDGWVKLRVQDSGRVGWMADFLLTASNN